MRPKPKTCKHCQMLFTPNHTVENYCSPECRRAAENDRVRKKRQAAKKSDLPKRDANA